MWHWSEIGFIALAVLLCSCGVGGSPNATPTEKATAVPPNEEKSVTQEQEEAMSLKLTSSAFDDGDLIPKLYTCDGEDISPPLAWTGAPSEAKSHVRSKRRVEKAREAPPLEGCVPKSVQFRSFCDFDRQRFETYN